MFKSLISFLIFTLLSLSSHANSPREINIDKLRWKNRILLVLVKSQSSSIWKAQQLSFKEKSNENKERQLILLKVFSTDKSILSRYKALYSFPIILIGKDSGIKAKFKEVTKMERIYKLIDSMPMRQKEMIQTNIKVP